MLYLFIIFNTEGIHHRYCLKDGDMKILKEFEMCNNFKQYEGTTLCEYSLNLLTYIYHMWSRNP